MPESHEINRSYIMSRIRGKNTTPEMYVRRFLHANGFRYSLNKRTLPGSPDIFLRKYNTAIFVNGCFWHMHEDCKCFSIPKTRTEWWTRKLLRNRERDQQAINDLRELGYKVIVIWECEINTIAKRKERLPKLVDEIKGVTGSE